ncbi:alginate export family protein [Sphingosinicella sp. BN140058]|uniref:alginate export family protein n=1 Tax=Sphingosinicella sp. BN140058 TaxID=1892855 RepID=UPI0013EC0848|nr:alginate export family protein [Sphingosinicella sp. BN140058]
MGRFQLKRLDLRHATAAAVVPVCLLATTAAAEDGALEIEGSVRARLEAIDGQFRAGAANGGALFLRTQLRAEYDAGPIRIGGEIQDARVYFERQPSSIGTTEVDTFEPIQAYVVGELGAKTELQVGRMTMDLGSRRLVSRQNFRNSTNAFTGVRFDWRPAKGDALTLFWTMPHDRLPNDSDGIRDNEFALNRERVDQQLFGAHSVKSKLFKTASLETYLYRLTERDGANFSTRNRHLWTGGFRILKPARAKAFDFELEAIGQRGTTRASTSAADRADLNVKAYFVHVAVGHTFAAAWSPRLVVSYDRASGDGGGRGYGRFDTLFGARVFEYGPSSLYGPIGRANLNSPELRLEVKPNKRWDGYVAGRPLWLESATDTFASTGLRDARGTSGRYAGTQFDARARYWLTPDRVRIAAGAAVLAKGRFLEDAPGSPSNGNTHFGYVEVTYGF